MSHATTIFCYIVGAIALRTFHESAGTITRESAIVERSLISAKQVYSKCANILERERDTSRFFDVVARKSREFSGSDK